VDVWTNGCIFFVFFALLEYTAVNAASRTDAKVRKKTRLIRIFMMMLIIFLIKIRT
jgi:hypothetical protein